MHRYYHGQPTHHHNPNSAGNVTPCFPVPYLIQQKSRFSCYGTNENTLGYYYYYYCRVSPTPSSPDLLHPEDEGKQEFDQLFVAVIYVYLNEASYTALSLAPSNWTQETRRRGDRLKDGRRQSLHRAPLPPRRPFLKLQSYARLKAQYRAASLHSSKRPTDAVPPPPPPP